MFPYLLFRIVFSEISAPSRSGILSNPAGLLMATKWSFSKMMSMGKRVTQKLFSGIGLIEIFQEAHFFFGKKTPFTAVNIFLGKIGIHYAVEVAHIIAKMFEYAAHDAV